MWNVLLDSRWHCGGDEESKTPPNAQARRVVRHAQRARVLRHGVWFGMFGGSGPSVCRSVCCTLQQLRSWSWWRCGGSYDKFEITMPVVRCPARCHASRQHSARAAGYCRTTRVQQDCSACSVTVYTVQRSLHSRWRCGGDEVSCSPHTDHPPAQARRYCNRAQG